MFKTTIELSQLDKSLPFYTHSPEQELVSRHIHEQHCWEIHETNALLELMKPGQSFIDIGANIGYYTVIAAARLGDSGQVFSFEPDPENYALLTQNIEQNHFKNVQAFNLGLSNQDCSLPIFCSEENRGDHRLFETEAHQQGNMIQLVKADEFFMDRYGQYPTVHCIKIDTQGYEYSIVDGLKKTIAANQAHLNMVVEFWPWGLRQNQSSAKALLALLDQYSLQIHIMDHIQGGIYSSKRKDLDKWLAEVEENPDNQGFVNLLLTPS